MEESVGQVESVGAIEVRHAKGRSRVHLELDADAVAKCLERDGVVTIRFREVGSTKLADLPSADVIVN